MEAEGDPVGCPDSGGGVRGAWLAAYGACGGGVAGLGYMLSAGWWFAPWAALDGRGDGSLPAGGLSDNGGNN